MLNLTFTHGGKIIKTVHKKHRDSLYVFDAYLRLLFFPLGLQYTIQGYSI